MHAPLCTVVTEKIWTVTEKTRTATEKTGLPQKTRTVTKKLGLSQQKSGLFYIKFLLKIMSFKLANNTECNFEKLEERILANNKATL